MIDEIVTAVLSSAGLTGSLFAAIISIAIKRAKKDAERKREERLTLEILRLEGEEKQSELLFAILRDLRGLGTEKELEDAEESYRAYLEKSRELKNKIIGANTFDL